jgi:hypothetical protein
MRPVVIVSTATPAPIIESRWASNQATTSRPAAAEVVRLRGVLLKIIGGAGLTYTRGGTETAEVMRTD